MSEQRTSRFQTALETVDKLTLEEKEMLFDIACRRFIEERRDQIARHAAESLQAVREGRARYGSLEDLERDLSREDGSIDADR